MFPYVLLVVIPLLFSLFSAETVETNVLNGQKAVLKKDNALPVFFVLFFLLLILRHESIGRDLANYKIIFNKHANSSLNEIFNDWKECLFRFFNWIMGKITNDYQIYLGIVAFLTVFPITWIYNKDKTNGFLKIITFVNMSTFIMIFSGLRQSIAMAVGMIAYHFVVNKKKKAFIICGFVGMMFHHSAFMIFLMYPAYYIKLERKHLYIAVPFAAGVFVFKNQVFGFLTKILSDSSGKYDRIAEETGAYGTLVLFVLFTVFVYVICDEEVMDQEAKGTRNFLFLATFLQIFAAIDTLAMRMNYYFILFVPIALGKCLNYPKKEMSNVARWGKNVITVFFLWYFLSNTYNSYITEKSALDTVPYRFFWE